MKFLVHLALSGILLYAAIAAQAPKYKSEAYGFACSFPAEVTQRKARSRDGVTVTTFQSVIVKKWGGLISTAYADPRETRNPRQFFADFLSSSMQSYAPRNLEHTTFLGRPALKFDVTADGPRGRAVLVLDEAENRIFAIVAMTMTQDDSMLGPFIDSFEIVAR